MAKKISVLIFLSLLFLKGKSKDYSVHHTTCTSNNACLTLGDYVNDTNQFFTSNTAFVFLEGTHYLNNTLTLCNLYNITLQGSGVSNIILSAGSNILCTNSTKIYFKSLKMLHSGQVNTGSDHSALYFNDSDSVILFDISFFRIFHDNFSSRAVRINNSTVQFTNCSFKNGFSDNGGALYITWSSVSFNGHNYFNNNTAQFNGGAICGEYSKILLSGQNLYNKNAANNSNNEGSSYIISSLSKGGGAISISFSTIVVRDVVCFINNSANYGGAIQLLNKSVCQVWGEIKFISNSATYGGAIAAYKSMFVHNEIKVDNSEEVSYDFESAFEVKSAALIFRNNSAGLLGGGVFLDTSSMVISGAVSFIGNNARSGGGISYSTSNPAGSKPIAMELQEPLNMTFYRNTAKKNGGAINIEDYYLDTYLCPFLAAHISELPCFFKIKNKTKSLSQMNLNFINNSATGSVLFGGAIEYCDSNISSLTGYEVLQNLSKRSFKIKDYASTPALRIRLCEIIQGSYKQDNIRKHVRRGQLFNLSVIVLGEFDLPIPDGVDFSLYSYYDKYPTRFRATRYNYQNFTGCQHFWIKLFTEREYEDLILHPPGCIHTSNSLSVHINLLECPPGFVRTIGNCTCDNTLLVITGYEDLCNIDTGLIRSPINDWIKPLLNSNQSYMGFMWYQNCPSSLCNKSNDIWLNFSSSIVDDQCHENCTGIVCGACKQNYSLNLNTLKCVMCNDNKYSGLIVVFIFAGIALIATLTLLHMTVASGIINGLILYANLVKICWSLFFPPEKVEVNLLTIFIAWMNLDLGISTCFYNGLDSYSYIWLQFIFPFYLWFLTGAIIIASKFSTRVMKLLGSNPVAVLATIILMSYTKLLLTSQGVLSYVTITYWNGNRENRWRLDPNIHYFKGKHFPLAVFAISVIALLLAPYILLLSFGYLLQAYSGKRGFRWFNRLKPILDAYYAPYSKNARFWTGFLLIVRTCLCIVSTITSNNESIILLIVIPSLLSFTTLIPWLKIAVYEKLYINVLEASFILNIIILASTTYHITQMKNNQLIITYISTGIAFVEFLGIVLFHVCLQLQKILFFKKRKETLLDYIKNRVKLQLNQTACKTKNIEKGNNVSTTVVDIREPLLDDCNTEL